MRVFSSARIRQSAVVGTLIVTVAAGYGVFSATGKEEEQEITVGTTSAPSTLDPAASWDNSWELFRNVYQTLLSYPSGASAPEPDAARSCRFTDQANQVFSCELHRGLEFSDGTPLDARAVKHSVDRIGRIKARGGPQGLLGNLGRVEVKDAHTVVFHLRKPDATFPFVLATPALSIVEPRAYPADKLRKARSVAGSGPYLLKSYQAGKRAVLVRNGSYRGFAERRRNQLVTIRYFTNSVEMMGALRKKQIDVTYRGLAAKDVVELQMRADDKGLQLVEGSATEVRYLAFNPKHRWARKPEVRRAIAQVLDRGALAHNVYRNTVESLYSMVPRGLAGHTTAYFDAYGNPDTGKAERILTEAGITEPVPLTLWYPTDRAGAQSKAEFQEIQGQLNATGLFEVKVEGRPWKAYVDGYRKGEYPLIGHSWYPDFPDAENFIAPFVGEQNALGIPYKSPEITEELLPKARRESDRGAVVEQFKRAQQILVDDARLLPLWQGKQYLATTEDIAGGERALDPSTIMMLWELHRKTSW